VEGLEDRALRSTLIVNSTADSGSGTLRDRVDNAQPGDVIRFDPGVFNQTINLTSGEIDVNVNLSIQGPGSNKLTISGALPSPIFGIGAGASVTLSGLSFTNSRGPRGAAIHDDSTGGQLTVQNCSFRYDVARLPLGTPGTAVGGAIASRAPLVVDSCDFDHDGAYGSDGPGMPPDQGNPGYGGAVYCDAPQLTVTNSTFEACSAGGGLGNIKSGIAYGGAVAWMPSSDTDSKAAPTAKIT
jgi:hypothetical protein